MNDLQLGNPSSYMALDDGTDVFSSDGSLLGRVSHVLADVEDDIFDGIIVDATALPGGHKFVDAPQVGRIYDRGVVLTIDAAEAESLPEPTENPGSIETGPDDMVADDLGDKLHRAWLRMTGRG